MIYYTNGDLIKMFENSEFDCIAHICNAQGLWKGGIHKSLGYKYKEIEVIADHVRLNKSRLNILGCVHYIHIKNNQGIYNLYSQRLIGSPSKDDTLTDRLVWLKSCLVRMFSDLSKSNSIKTCGLPLILSGLAADKQLKGNKTDLEYFKQFILPTVEEVLNNYPNIELTIVNYKK